jgi:hypothetical protein
MVKAMQYLNKTYSMLSKYRDLLIIKVKPSLCLVNWAVGHEGVLKSGHIAPLFLTSPLGEGKWSASRPGAKVPGTYCIAGFMAPIAGLEAVE